MMDGEYPQRWCCFPCQQPRFPWKSWTWSLAMLGRSRKPLGNVSSIHFTGTLCNKDAQNPLEDLISGWDGCGSCPSQTFLGKKSPALNSSCQTRGRQIWNFLHMRRPRITAVLWPAKPLGYLKQIPRRFLQIFFSKQVKFKYKHENASSNPVCQGLLMKLSFTSSILIFQHV